MSRSSRRARRDPPAIARSPDLHRPSSPLADPDLVFGGWTTPALAGTDRRFFSPSARPVWSSGVNVSPAVRRPGVPARYRVSPVNVAAVAFDKPAGVPVCVRRRVRREVLHARGFGGVRKLRRPHFNPFSKVSC